MIRVIGVVLLCVLALVTEAFSSVNHTPVRFIFQPYELAPAESRLVPNIFMFPIRAICTIIDGNEENLLSLKVLNRSGTLNETKLSQGDSIQISVRVGDKFQITADPGAKVLATNSGSKTIKGHCMTV